MDQRKINRLTVLLLTIGLGSALFVALTAETPLDDPLLGHPMDSKKYLRELQVIGGKANIMASEFQDWFAEQWQGPALARTIAILTVVTTGAFRFVASHPAPAATPPEEKLPPSGSG